MKKLSKRLLACLLIITMLSSNIMSSSYASTNQIQGTSEYDIEEEMNINLPEDIRGHWAEKEMTAMFEKGYFKGYEDGLSHPESYITRAQVVSMVNRLLGLSYDESMDMGDGFNDIQESDWFYDDVMLAKNNGYILGYDDMSFRPNEEMTRFEITQLLSRLLPQKEINENITFTDEAYFPSWVKVAMEKVKAFQLFTGYEDVSFRGRQSMTRGEWLAVLYRCEKDIKSVTDIEESIENEEITETENSTGTGTSNGGN
ncbi:MAG: S-layer homology domain-containing protein, partial [Sedimentibacter sp.]